MNLRWKIIAVATTIASVVCASADAQPTESELILLRALDHAFKPGFFSNSGGNKNEDGTYSRTVTTGDAIAKPTFAKPLETAKAACIKAGGVLTLAISAGRYSGSVPQTVIQAGEQRLEINYPLLYGLYSDLNSAQFDAGSLGFKPMFRTSHFAERAAKQADAAPPLGLFQCSLESGAGLWAVAIMPAGMPFGYDLPIRVTPITQDWIKAHHAQLAKRSEDDQRRRIAADRRQRGEIDHAKNEAIRLRSFQATVKVGSRTNCGIVIAIRDPLVQVQLPPYIIGPSGVRDFWVPRDELTDATPPQGCKFGA